MGIGERECMLFGPCLASILASIAILFMSPLSKHWVANDRGCLTSTGQIILSTGCLVLSSALDVL